jgi:hypothetical protein
MTTLETYLKRIELSRRLRRAVLTFWPPLVIAAILPTVVTIAISSPTALSICLAMITLSCLLIAGWLFFHKQPNPTTPFFGDGSANQTSNVDISDQHGSASTKSTRPANHTTARHLAHRRTSMATSNPYAGSGAEYVRYTARLHSIVFWLPILLLVPLLVFVLPTPLAVCGAQW